MSEITKRIQTLRLAIEDAERRIMSSTDLPYIALQRGKQREWQNELDVLRVQLSIGQRDFTVHITYSVRASSKVDLHQEVNSRLDFELSQEGPWTPVQASYETQAGIYKFMSGAPDKSTGEQHERN